MPDEDIRALERAASMGDLEASRRLLVHEIRTKGYKLVKAEGSKFTYFVYVGEIFLGIAAGSGPQKWEAFANGWLTKPEDKSFENMNRHLGFFKTRKAAIQALVSFHTTRQNPDEDIRRLERDAAMGDPEAKQKLLIHEIRTKGYKLVKAGTKFAYFVFVGQSFLGIVHGIGPQKWVSIANGWLGKADKGGVILSGGDTMYHELGNFKTRKAAIQALVSFHTTRQNPDEDMRALERAARMGDPETKKKLLVHEIRTKGISVVPARSTHNRAGTGYYIYAGQNQYLE